MRRMTEDIHSGTWSGYLEKAVEAAREAGHLQIESLNRGHTVTYKGETDLVTEVDRACEDAIVRILGEAFPSHDFLLEETPSLPSGSSYLWVVDPLDGTTNYTHRFPHFCCSIALQHHHETVVGVVYDPLLDELFTAIRGGGAFLNGLPIEVSSEDRLIRCLLATGFPYDIASIADNNIARFSRMLPHAQGIRRCGSAALDLCYLASGRLDGYWVVQLALWDAAAGILLVEEAGGCVTDLHGQAPSLPVGGLVGSNGRIHQELFAILDAC